MVDARKMKLFCLSNRMKNRLWYLEFGTSEAIFSTCKNLHEDIDIMVNRFRLHYWIERGDV